MPDHEIKKNLELREITPADLGEIARFVIRVSGSQTPPTQAEQRLSWILLENPAREPGDPLGWFLRAPSGEIVGCMCCAPQKFCFGQKVLRLMMANSFYVDDRYRGGGTSIFLKYLQLGRRWPLFVSSANPMVAEMWKKLGGFPLGESDYEVLGIVRWPPLLAESVHRKTGSRLLARITETLATPFSSPRALLGGAPDGTLTPVPTPEEAARLCAQHHSDKVTACRDEGFLKWRYFSQADKADRLFAFHRNGDEKKQCMVAVRLQNRGYQQKIRALHVLDIWGEADAETYLAIANSLTKEYRRQIDMLVFRCLSPAQRQTMQAKGFNIRAFPAPIAWCMDKSKLLPANIWYFVPADGDMFL